MPLTVLVLQELGEVEELRDEFLDVHRVLHAGLPRRRHRVELPIRAVKPGGIGHPVGAHLSPSMSPPRGLPAGRPPAALQLDVEGGEGLGADQVVHDARRIGVVRAVVELVHGARGVLEALVPGGEMVVVVGCPPGASQELPASPPSLIFGDTHFSFTSRACRSLATPMGLARSRNTAGLVRSRVSET